MEHMALCPWCWPRARAAVRYNLHAELCAQGEDLRRVVEYRRNPEDAAPR